MLNTQPPDVLPPSLSGNRVIPLRAPLQTFGVSRAAVHGIECDQFMAIESSLMTTVLHTTHSTAIGATQTSVISFSTSLIGQAMQPRHSSPTAASTAFTTCRPHPFSQTTESSQCRSTA